MHFTDIRTRYVVFVELEITERVEFALSIG